NACTGKICSMVITFLEKKTVNEDLTNMSIANKAHYQAEKGAIHMLLTGIGDEIYSIVDARKTAHKMWIAIERLQQEANEIRAEKIARNANLLVLVAAAQQYPDPYYQAPKPQRSYAPAPKQYSSTRSNVSTRNKGKEIAKPITPPSESASEEDRKDTEKGVPLQAEQADWLEDMNKEFDEQELEAHYSFMEKIQELLTADSGTDTEPLEQVHNDAEYNVFANVRQHSEQPKSTYNTCLVEKDDSNVTPDSPDMCDNDIQTDQNADERAALANLIANLKLGVDENKKIQKQLKKANASLAQELKECKSILAETSKTMGESNSIRDSCIVALQNK
ncbi:hypothetical protein Tco_1496984, partial [Tanacetum coccineum]